MKRVTASLAVGLLALVASVALFPATAAADRVCRGVVGSAYIDDDVRVPAGARCVLRGTRVDGNVKVYRGGVLGAVRVRVDGNVQAENARAVSVMRRSRIGGNVQVEQGGAATVWLSYVGGDVQYEQNRALLRVVRARVDGNVQVFQNRAPIRIRINGISGEGFDQPGFLSACSTHLLTARREASPRRSSGGPGL